MDALGRTRRTSDSDLWEQSIADNPSSYSVIAFTPQKGTRSMPEIPTFEEAYSYAKEVLELDNRVRSCMIYAVNEYKNHALVGTIGRHDLQFKEVKRKV